jgi:hypothetical protein
MLILMMMMIMSSKGMLFDVQSDEKQWLDLQNRLAGVCETWWIQVLAKIRHFGSSGTDIKFPEFLRNVPIETACCR